MADVTLKSNDTRPTLQVTLKEGQPGSQAPINLATASLVKFLMKTDVGPLIQRTAVVLQATEAGTVATSGQTVTGSGTSFVSVLAVGDEILVGGQTRTVSAITSDTQLTVSAAFSPNLSAGTPYIVKVGQVTVTFVAPDTATAGEYNGEFEITRTGGGIETVPNDGWITVSILEDLN